MDLPVTGEPGFEFEDAATVPGLVTLILVRERRARANEGHLATENVKELRKLIQAGAAEKTAQRRDAGIVPQLVDAFTFTQVAFAFDESRRVLAMDGRIVVHVHSTELQKVELLAVLSDALLAEEDRAVPR